MKRNVFDQEETMRDDVLTHADQEEIIKMAKASNVGNRIIGLLFGLSSCKSFLTPVTPTLVSFIGIFGASSCVSGKQIANFITSN